MSRCMCVCVCGGGGGLKGVIKLDLHFINNSCSLKFVGIHIFPLPW